MLNFAMKKYEQIEVMPLYMSFLTFGNMFSGMYLFGEGRLYSDFEIVLVFLSVLILVVGMVFIFIKPMASRSVKSENSKDLEIRKIRLLAEIDYLTED